MKVKHGLPCEVGIRKEALSTDQIPRVKIWVRAYLLGQKWPTKNFHPKPFYNQVREGILPI